MKSFKRIDGDYTIQMVNSEDVLTLDSSTVEVTGNLEVTGNVTYVNTEQLNVNDPFLALNDNEAASYSSNAGILVHKTSTTYAGLRYNDTTGQWEISSSTGDDGTTGTWQAIAGGGAGTVAGANTQVQFNDDGAFGAEANFTYDKDTNQMSIDGSVALVDQGSAPANVGSSTVLYANTAGSGGSGVYVVDDTVNEELVTKSKAIVFGIIF